MMAKTTWKKLKIGDVFSIEANTEDALIGQVLINGITFYMQVTDIEKRIFDGSFSQLSASKTLFIGETTDAEFKRENWSICGNLPIKNDFLRPYHVVWTKPLGEPDGLVLQDFERNTIRIAQEGDMEIFGYKTSVSPTNFTTATKSYFEYGADHDFGSVDAKRVALRSTLR